jgi:methylated-DNA-[protein]-cysteine S-methyltransferase
MPSCIYGSITFTPSQLKHRKNIRELEMTSICYDYLETPIGLLMLAGDGEVLVELGFPGGKAARRHDESWTHASGKFKDAKNQLLAYFAGELRDFSLSLAPQGTDFQLQVWQALQSIPYGQTWSYGQLAKHIHKPKASRAVGAANGRNPIPVIIPCHRVIGSSGKLVGFGGGLETKQHLLALEKDAIHPGLGF